MTATGRQLLKLFHSIKSAAWKVPMMSLKFKKALKLLPIKRSSTSKQPATRIKKNGLPLLDMPL